MTRLISVAKMIIISFVIFSIHQAYLFAGVGTTACQFLKILPSARSAGMAGAFAAQANDSFAVYSNPAGLVLLQKTELVATYMRYFADINFGYIGYSSKLRDVGYFGFGMTYLIIDKIQRRDVLENLQGEFNAKDICMSFAYAKENAFPSVLEDLNIGGSLKIISSEIDSTVAFTGALDISALYSPLEKVMVMLGVQNISPGIKFKEETDPLPLNIKAGVCYTPFWNLSLNGEIDEYLLDNKFYLSFGTEYWVVKNLSLRAGYRFGYDNSSLGSIVGLSGGIGFRIWNFGVDYAFVPFGELGDTHRVTFLYKF